MKKLLIITLLLSLNGCALFSENKKIETPVVQKINIDQALLQECGDLLQLTSAKSFNDILIVTKENTILYYSCKEKHKALANILRKSYE
jgi:hypothetical protein